MRKKIFTVLAMILCVSFCFAGCNLFPENSVFKENQTVVSTGNVTISREEFIKGYNNYYSTFYNQSNGNSETALDSLMKYLVSKKLYLNDANKLIESGEIVLTKTEQNYLWYVTYTSLITNIESFEKAVKVALEIENEKEEEKEDEEKKQEPNFVYTPYEKKAEIIFNEITKEYEIVVIKQILVVKTNDEGKEEYEYVNIKEALDYDDSDFELYDINFVFNSINKDKLFSENENLTAEEIKAKTISMESIRRYISQLLINEEGKNLSTDSKEVLEREIKRIYGILYENLIINKLYEHKTEEIKVNEDDVLNLYLSKVKECYDRYYEDPDAFIKELTTTIGSANMYGSYGTASNSIEDVFYKPNNLEENFFYITHIVVNLTAAQIQQVNELKEYCEANGKTSEYYEQEFYKIVPNITADVINKTIDLIFKLKEGTISQQQYDEKLLEIIGSKLLMVSERDSEGYVTKDVMTVQEMIANLYKELDEIYVKYYGQANQQVTINGHVYSPTEAGLITAETNLLLKEQLEIDYQNERADKFNEYIYKYGADTGTIQIQTSYFGDKNENWYLYAMGDKTTGDNFVKQFADAARELFNKGEITGYTTVLMENWSSKDGVETLNSQSTAFSTMMYGGMVNNLFECFNNNKFELSDLFQEETDGHYAKYYSLLKMDQYRLGLTMNKTLFDLIFEMYYNTMYNEIIQIYEDAILEGIDFSPNRNVIKDIIG